jgi:chemotaxis methyl-accepting protein methylase
MSSLSFSSVIEQLRKDRGIDLSCYRKVSLERRIQKRMESLGLKDPDEYLEYIKTEAAEMDRLLDAILVNTSSFFRNPLVFEHIWRDVLPEIGFERDFAENSPVNIWCCGCSTGEEPYSMAILLRDLPSKGFPPLSSTIFATDIDPDALKKAEEGCYPLSRLDNVHLRRVENYFSTHDDIYCVKPEIRHMVSFSVHDVLSPEKRVPKDSVFSSFDIILCRNLLIYFSPRIQARILEDLERALNPGGFLVLGEAESLHGMFQGKFEQIPGNCRIYRKIY